MTIRLPFAPPQDYGRWLDWTDEVVSVLDERFPPSSPERPVPDQAVARVLPVHKRLTAAQVRTAVAKGRALVAPELSAEAEVWERSVDYLDRAYRWVGDLSGSGVVPTFPEDLMPLRKATWRTIEGVLAGKEAPPPTAARIVPTSEPGEFRVGGEIDLTTADFVMEVAADDLEVGHHVTLDFSAVTFIDSQGLRMLIRLGAVALERDLDPVRVVAPPRTMTRLLMRAVPRGIPGVQLEGEDTA